MSAGTMAPTGTLTASSYASCHRFSATRCSLPCGTEPTPGPMADWFRGGAGSAEGTPFATLWRGTHGSGSFIQDACAVRVLSLAS